MLMPWFGLGPLVRGSERCYEQLCALRFEHDFGTAADHQTSFTGGEECMFYAMNPGTPCCALPGRDLLWRRRGYGLRTGSTMAR